MAPSNPGNKTQDVGKQTGAGPAPKTAKAAPAKQGGAGSPPAPGQRGPQKGERPIADVDRKVRGGDA